MNRPSHGVTLFNSENREQNFYSFLLRCHSLSSKKYNFHSESGFFHSLATLRILHIPLYLACISCIHWAHKRTKGDWFPDSLVSGIYLSISLLGALSRWSLWSDHSVSVPVEDEPSPSWLH